MEKGQRIRPKTEVEQDLRERIKTRIRWSWWKTLIIYLYEIGVLYAFAASASSSTFFSLACLERVPATKRNLGAEKTRCERVETRRNLFDVSIFSASVGIS